MEHLFSEIGIAKDYTGVSKFREFMQERHRKVWVRRYRKFGKWFADFMDIVDIIAVLIAIALGVTLLTRFIYLAATTSTF